MRLRAAALPGLMLAALASGAEASGTETSLRYSAFVVPPEAVVHGWQGSIVAGSGRRVAWVLDGGGHYLSGGSVHTLLAGPRFSTRPSRGGVSLFTQVLAGVGVVRADETVAMFTALPGVGVDLGVDKPAGFRFQVDWPIVTNYGVVAVAPRVSAGVVLRGGRR